MDVLTKIKNLAVARLDPDPDAGRRLGDDRLVRAWRRPAPVGPRRGAP